MSEFHTGGYHRLRQPLISGGLHQHTAADPSALSDVQYEAINLVQGTAWEINVNVLNLMLDVKDAQMEVEGMPFGPDLPIPEKMADEAWEALSPKEKTAYKYELSVIHDRNANRAYKRESFMRKLHVAIEMVGQDGETDPDVGAAPIWFPHFFDWRTRMYPMPQDLTPQGDHIAKALLQFHNGQRLGAEGYYWFQIGLANAFGKDKLLFKDRELFCAVNHDLIIDSALDPLDGQRFWMEAEEPYIFWAHCVEYYEMHTLANPHDYESKLPGAMDGVTNGLQHLSLIGKDTYGAIRTNCSDEEKRYDLYTEVMTTCIARVSDDAIRGVAEAQAWAGHITRKVVKRAVMTTPYGVTPRGIADQLIKDGHCDGPKEHSSLPKAKLAAYMRDVIIDSLRSTVVAALEVMQYLQQVGKILAEHNIPMRWRTSAGAYVTQSYFNATYRMVQTLLGKVKLWSEDPAEGLKASKCAASAAPNVIHSQDAAMLQLTVVRLKQQYGVDSYAMIHDSYGVHYGHVAAMHKVLREVAVEMYQGDWLGEFHQQMLGLASSVPDLVLPTPPALGDFDVTRVIRSPYFFS